MTPQDAGGLELAQAIDSLARALSRALLQARQAESVFQVEPIELTLRVAAIRTGSGPDGIEWRVLALGDQAVPPAGALHSLTMRVTPRSPGQVSEQGERERVREQRPDVQVPGLGGQGQRRDSPDVPSAPRGFPPSAPGGFPSAAQIRRVREGLPSSSWGRGPETKGPEPAAIRGADKVIVVRVRYLDAGQSGQPRRLVIEQEFKRVPGSPQSDRRLVEIDRMLGDPRRGDAERDRLVKATAEYVASRVDSRIARPTTYRWEIQGVLDPAAVSDALDRSEQWLQGLVQRPLESAAGPAGGIAANVPFVPVADAVQNATQIIDVIGIVIGTATGMHPLVMASIKHLAHTEFHREVAEGVAQAFDGLLAGSIDKRPTDTLAPAATSPQPGGEPASPAPQPTDKPAPTEPSPQPGGEPASPAPQPTDKRAPTDPSPRGPTPGGFSPGGFG